MRLTCVQDHIHAAGEGEVDFSPAAGRSRYPAIGSWTAALRRRRRRNTYSEGRKRMEKALDDITVLDLGQVIAMPFCTMLLADMGARVIKVESLEQAKERLSLGMKRVRNGVEERVSVYQYRDRNKQAITLNLKTPQGVALFKELVPHVDVVTENFSVGTMERLGLGYQSLQAINPRLIYAAIMAFGQYGPYAPQRGYDIL